MADTISNKHKQCKDCKWLKIGRHNECYSRGEGECTQPYRNHVCNVSGRYFSSMACSYFEEREDNMDIEKTINDCEDALENISYVIDMLEKQVVEEPPISEEDNIPINRYGIGQTLYLPVKVVGIRNKKTPNGSNIVLYEFSTATDQRIGFKIFENASDIWRDKDHYILSLPEEYIRDHFKEE